MNHLKKMNKKFDILKLKKKNPHRDLKFQLYIIKLNQKNN